MKTETERLVVSLNDTIKIIGCKTTTFYNQHRQNLTQAGKIGRNVYYDLKQVEAYKKKILKPTANFKIISHE